MLWMWCQFGVSLVADLLRWTRLYDPASASGIIWCVVNYGGGSGVVKWQKSIEIMQELYTISTTYRQLQKSIEWFHPFCQCTAALQDLFQSGPWGGWQDIATCSRCWPISWWHWNLLGVLIPTGKNRRHCLPEGAHAETGGCQKCSQPHWPRQSCSSQRCLLNHLTTQQSWKSVWAQIPGLTSTETACKKLHTAYGAYQNTRLISKQLAQCRPPEAPISTWYCKTYYREHYRIVDSFVHCFPHLLWTPRHWRSSSCRLYLVWRRCNLCRVSTWTKCHMDSSWFASLRSRRCTSLVKTAPPKSPRWGSDWPNWPLPRCRPDRPTLCTAPNWSRCLVRQHRPLDLPKWHPPIWTSNHIDKRCHSPEATYQRHKLMDWK